MRRLIERFAELATDNVGTALVVGAGQGSLLAPLRRARPRRLILAEANPRVAESLSQRIDAGRGEETWPSAIGADPASSATLHPTVPPAHSSLRVPDRLLGEFPNIGAASAIDVSSRPIGDVVTGLGLEAGLRHLLVLDAPGQSFDLLSAMPASGLRAFSAIVASTSDEPLYAGETPHDGVVAILERLGYAIVYEDPESIHPYRAVLALRDEASVARLVLEEELARRTEENTRLLKHVEGLQFEFERRVDALAEAIAARQAADEATQAAQAATKAAHEATKAVHAEKEAADAATRAVEAERDAARAEVEALKAAAKRDAAARDDAKARISALEQSLARATAEHAERTSVLSSDHDAATARAEERIAALAAEIDAAAASAASAEARIAALVAERDAALAGAQALASAEARIAALVAERDAALAGAQALREDVKRHVAVVETTGRQLDAATAARDQAIAEAAQVRHDAETQAAALSAELAATAKRAEEAGTESTRLQELVARHEEALRAAGEAKDELQRRVESGVAHQSKLASELAGKTKLLDEAVARVAERDAALRQAEEAKAELQRRVESGVAHQAKLASDLAGRSKLLEEAVARVAEREAALREAEEAQVELRRRVESGVEHQSRLASDLAGKTKLLEDAIARSEALEVEREAVRKQGAEARDALEAKIGAQRLEIANCMQSLSLSVRLQTMREADLADLQARHLELRQRSDEQHRVLSKLAERLSAASGYFHQLMLGRASTAGLAAEAEDVAILSAVPHTPAAARPPRAKRRAEPTTSATKPKTVKPVSKRASKAAAKRKR